MLVRWKYNPQLIAWYFGELVVTEEMLFEYDFNYLQSGRLLTDRILRDCWRKNNAPT